MNKLTIALSTLALLAAAAIVQAGTPKDCMLEGTVHKSGQPGAETTNVKFRTMEKYDDNSNCRVRSGEKLEFKLPADPRLENAPDGSSVKYRYQENEKGETQTRLISVGA